MYFRIFNYLKLKIFFLAFFKKNKTKINLFISRKLTENVKKKFIIFTSYGRVSLILILNFLKSKQPLKKEIIVSPYNLPEVVNVIKRLNFNVIYCDINYNTGFYDLANLRRKINKNTAAVVLTNMFNTYNSTIKLKNICNKKKVFLIEDNAIFFDNYKKNKNQKYYSGSFGDFTFLSFNIMKNLPALLGGATLTSDKNFYNYALQQKNKFNNLYTPILLKQIIIFFIIKLFSNKFLYKKFFFNIIKFSHKYKINFIIKLFYPSLKFKNLGFPKNYFSKISFFQKKLIYLQLSDNKTRQNNHILRKDKNIYYYKKLKKIKNKNINLINIKDFNFQNFIDFPILVKKRDKLHEYLLNNSIETRLYYYKNCEYLFEKKSNSSNSTRYEKEILCLPNGKHISFEYIDKIVDTINSFRF